MKEFECREYFSFRTQKVDPCKTTIVVIKSDKILVMCMIYITGAIPINHCELCQKVDLHLIDELEMVEFYFYQVYKNFNQIEQH